MDLSTLLSAMQVCRYNIMIGENEMERTKIALLIDGENVSSKYIKLIMDEVAEFGVPTYKRVYGDFQNPSVSSWTNEFNQYALSPVIQYNYTSRKNASDTALIIDAMDILHTSDVDGFCLVTSDSDFTKLALRLREAGKLVIGMGEQKTPTSLVSACEHFKYLDLLDKETQQVEVEEEESKTKATKKNSYVDEFDGVLSLSQLGYEIKKIVRKHSDEDGWVRQALVGNELIKRVPGFDPRNYGYHKLGKLMQSFGFIESEMEENPKDKRLKVVYVRIKNNSKRTYKNR